MTRRAWLLSLASVLACSGGPLVPAGGPGPLGPTGSGNGNGSGGLVGEWRRELVFIDDLGYVHSSATTWYFFEDGSAARSIVTTNFTLGVSDEAVAMAQWSTDAGRVTIDFTSPNPGRIVLDYRIEGSRLLLAGQEYLRAR